ncbi:TPA: glycosyltransferase [Streptococcus suis]|nr:glycosyltransferase [Streptococcus suis]HEL1586919.1 glycosyltransferase [Streptococcus suis]
MIRVTIAMSTYNGQEFLKEQLDSIVQQTILDNPEVSVTFLVRDDGSSDNTLAILNEYAGKHPRLLWNIISGKNIGWKKSFIALMEAVSSDFVFLCDQDDIWNLNKCQVMLDTMQSNPQIEVLMHRIEYYYTSDVGVKKILNDSYEKLGISKNDGEIEKVPQAAHFSHHPFLGCCFLFTDTIRQEFLKVQSHRDNSIAHDVGLFILGSARNSTYYLNRQLIKYRQHSSNATSVQKTPSIIQQAKNQKKTTKIFYENLMTVLTSIQELTSNSSIKTDARQMYLRIEKEYKALIHRRGLQFTKLKRGEFGFNKLMLIDILVALI